jgi:PhnB protein
VVSPCLLVESIEQELKFLQAVFNVTAHVDQKSEQTIWQIEAKLGDTTLKIGRAAQGAPQSSSVLYVWTDDVDGTFARAMNAGATLISVPTDQPGGIREAGFHGPQGTIWWIGRRTGRISTREGEEKLRQQRKARL